MRNVLEHVRNNVVGYVALFLALGLGTAWAATELKRNDVRSKHIKNGQVKSADLRDGGVMGADVSEASLGEVPAADHASTAAAADHASTAASADHASTATSAGDAATVDGKDADDFAPADAEDWRVVTEFAEGSSEAGRFREASGSCYDSDIYGPCFWHNNPYPPSHNEAAFYRDPFGRVHLQGYVCKHEYGATCSGDILSGPDDIFQLPEGYRPDHLIEVPSVSRGDFGRVLIDADGTVSAAPPSDYDGVSLESISFRCAPAGQDGCP